MPKTTFGDKLRALREARGISLRALSEELGKMGHPITHAGLQRYERETGAALPRRAMLAALCKFFAVEPSWFIEDLYQDAAPRKPEMRELNDLDLLNDEEFDILVKIKDQFLKTRAAGKVARELG